MTARARATWRRRVLVTVLVGAALSAPNKQALAYEPDHAGRGPSGPAPDTEQRLRLAEKTVERAVDRAHASIREKKARQESLEDRP